MKAGRFLLGKFWVLGGGGVGEYVLRADFVVRGLWGMSCEVAGWRWVMCVCVRVRV